MEGLQEKKESNIPDSRSLISFGATNETSKVGSVDRGIGLMES